MEKKLGRADAALESLTELAASRNPYRVRALEALAKHYEHAERNCAMALEMTRAALEIEVSPALRRREQRLKTRMERTGQTWLTRVAGDDDRNGQADAQHDGQNAVDQRDPR
jgi:hypothetical protein